MSLTKLKCFGHYLILDHLKNGGMAEICRARYISEDVDKIVAIKVIREKYSQDKAFKAMFMDEIKMTFGLIHPNICQIYDYGELDGQLYMVMEYVDGHNLKEYLNRLQQRKFILPIEISINIASHVCQALSYAHNFTDQLTGMHLKIIHRDISPHNVMVSYDGAIKVIDFGIAKAATNQDETQVGTIKGKLSYLAPEYLDGELLDHRYDQFSVGITLWEMLCGQKLFDGKNEVTILKKVQAAQIPPPSSINPKVPNELDAIVLKTLKKKKDDRYENMDELIRVLEKFLYSHYPDFISTDIKKLSNQLFKVDIHKERRKFVEFGKIDIRPYLPQKSETSHPPPLPLDIDAPILEEVEEEENEENTQDIPFVPEESKKKHFSIIFTSCLIILIGLILGMTVNYYLYKRKINKEHLLNQNRKMSSKMKNDNLENDQNNRYRIIALSNTNVLQRFYLNNKRIKYDYGLKIKINKKVHLRIEQDGKLPLFLSFEVTNNSPSSYPLSRAQDTIDGILESSADWPSGSTLSFKILEHEVFYKMPIKNMRIPVGNYQGIIRNSFNQTEKKVKFKLEEDMVTTI